MARTSGFPQPILDIADPEDRRAAAAAAAGGAGMFYAFGNFCALAAAPDEETIERMNRLKGRPLGQVGSVTRRRTERRSSSTGLGCRGRSGAA